MSVASKPLSARTPTRSPSTTARAIEAFEATLITPAPFDAYLNGDDAALADDQKQGLSLFIEKGCSACHSGVNVGGHGYYRGANIAPWRI